MSARKHDHSTIELAIGTLALVAMGLLVLFGAAFMTSVVEVHPVWSYVAGISVGILLSGISWFLYLAHKGA